MPYSIKKPMPLQCGIGLRSPHFNTLLKKKYKDIWLEVHPENYLSGGGESLQQLYELRKHYPMSFHCLGFSLGSHHSINLNYAKKIKSLSDQLQPFLISDHMSWSRLDNTFTHDLLPIPYTHSSLKNFIANINQAQDSLKQQILIENPSSYLSFSESTIPEWEFLSEASKVTGCGVLLDINNIFVNSKNHGFSPKQYLHFIKNLDVQELHLAGHHINKVRDISIYIDDHGSAISPEVWSLFKQSLVLFPKANPLIEWDTNIPDLPTLLKEKAKAKKIISELKN